MKKILIVFAISIAFYVAHASNGNPVEKMNYSFVKKSDRVDEKKVTCKVTVMVDGVEESATAEGKTIKEACDKAYKEVRE